MLIRDELDVRMLVALMCGPSHAYGVVKQVEEDGAGLTPADIRSIYRKLSQLANSGHIAKEEGCRPPTYRLEAKTDLLLKAHSHRMERLSRTLRKRLKNV